MELCSMLCGSLERRGVWVRMDTWTCMVESLCCSPETITTLLISYTPIRNKMFKKQNKMQKKFLMSSRKNKTLVCNTGSHTLVCAVLSCFSHVRLFVTLWTVVRQPSLSIGLSRQEYWSGFAVLSSRGSSQPRDQTHVSCISYIVWQAGSLPLVPPGKPEVKMLVAQSCPTLCNLMDYSLLCFSVHGILQARTLEWVALTFSGASSQLRHQMGSPALQVDSFTI